MADIQRLDSVPRHRPDLEATYWQQGDLRQFNWYTWDYTCPRCGFTGELVCGVVRRVRDEQGDVRDITATERADQFARQRAEFNRDAENLCPACRKRKQDRGFVPSPVGDA